MLPLRIVVCEDEPPVLSPSSRGSLQQSQAVLAATGRTGSDAIQLAASHNPDLVLLDAALPQVDGLTGMRVLRNLAPRLRVALAADDPDALEEEAERFQVAALMAKPVGALELALLCRRELAVRRAREAAARAGLLFFGEFLVGRGEIDGAQLTQALAFMERANTRLGEHAVAAGLLGPDQAERVFRAQRTEPSRFGEMAVSMGMLNRAQLERLLETQRASRVRLGEALVRMGHLRAGQLGDLLKEFRSLLPAPMQLPHELLHGPPQGRRIVALLPDLVRRLTHVEAKVAPAEGWSGGDEGWTHLGSVYVESDPGLLVALGVETVLARALAASDPEATGFDPVERLDLAVERFAELLCRQAVEDPGCRVTTASVDLDASSGWAFPLVGTRGAGALFLAFDRAGSARSS